MARCGTLMHSFTKNNTACVDKCFQTETRKMVSRVQRTKLLTKLCRLSMSAECPRANTPESKKHGQTSALQDMTEATWNIVSHRETIQKDSCETWDAECSMGCSVPRFTSLLHWIADMKAWLLLLLTGDMCVERDKPQRLSARAFH